MRPLQPVDLRFAQSGAHGQKKNNVNGWLLLAELMELRWILAEEDLLTFEWLYSLCAFDRQAGPLLDTAWPDLTPMFQWIFAWIWNPFELLLGHLPVSRNADPIDDCTTVEEAIRIVLKWVKDPDAHMRWELDKAVRFFQSHRLFAVCDGPIHQSDKSKLKEQFSDFLDNFAEGRQLPAQTDLFGSFEQWNKFLRLYDEIGYDCTGDGSAAKRRSLSHAVNEFIDVEVKNGTKSDGSKDAHRYKADYVFLERLMFACFESNHEFGAGLMLASPELKVEKRLIDEARGCSFDRLNAIAPLRLLRRLQRKQIDETTDSDAVKS